VWKSEKWRHADEENVNREKAVDQLIGMLTDLMKRAKKEDHNLAPFIGLAVPGKIEEDGSIAKAHRTCPAIGKAANSTWPQGSPRRSRRSAITT